MVRPTAQAAETAAGASTGHQRLSQLAGVSGLGGAWGAGRTDGQPHLGEQPFLEPRRRRGARGGAEDVLKFLFHGIHIVLEAAGEGREVRLAVSFLWSSASAWRRRYLTVLVATPSASAVSCNVRSW